MPITPIDLATIAPRSQETVISKQPEVQKPVTDNSNANVQTQQKVQKQSDTVIQTQKNENPEYRYDAKEGGGNSGQYTPGQNKSGHKSKKELQKTEEEKKFGQGIDIRI